MSCPCETNFQYNQPNQPVNTNCEYTLETIQDWKTKVMCAKAEGIIKSEAEYNKYMGIILSGVNFSSNICYLKKELDSIAPIIVNIINSGLC